MSNQNWRGADADDDEDDEGNDDTPEDVDWGGRDGIIFLIDATESMFGEDEMLLQQGGGQNELYFRTALKCCQMTMLKKVMGSDKDLIAVVLFGTEKKENHLELNHLYVLQSLEEPNVQKIKALDEMIKSDSVCNFTSRYGHSENYALQDALWLCQSIFANCELKMTMQRILMFTANDEPHANNRVEQQRALGRAADLRGLNILLELLPMGCTFNVNLFYKDLIETAVGDDYAEQALGRCVQNKEELLQRTCRYSHKKRTISRRLLYLGPKLAIGVGVYCMLHSNPYPKSVWLEGATNLPVRTAKHHFSVETGEVVLPMEIAKVKSYGDQEIFFDTLETQMMSNILEPGIYLMGFKPKDRIKTEYHISKPYFIFPDDHLVKGSRKAFASLLKRCADREKVMICWAVLRSGGQPKLFALCPQLEEINPETGAQESAAGFYAFPLPLCGNFQQVDVDPLPEPTKPQVDFMNKVVNKLTFRYNVHNFQDPGLQTLWAGIEALALMSETPREVQDSTKPQYDIIEKKLESIGIQCDDVFFTSNSKLGKTVTKRAADEDIDQLGKQRKKEEVNVEAYAKSGKAESLLVNQLKEFLSARGRKVSGKKKSDLVAMVYEEVNPDNL